MARDLRAGGTDEPLAAKLFRQATPAGFLIDRNFVEAACLPTAVATRWESPAGQTQMFIG